MRAGRLRHKIRLERATETQSAFGEPVKAWTLLKEVWGAVEPLKGAERQRAQQASAVEDVRIVVRWSSDIASLNVKDRVVFGTKIYDIKSVLNINERNSEFNLMAVEHIDAV
jgi:SPP1 family predicted phage head-tail adaptor